ncbi:hypothetical protein X777_14684 [Ooceraea biroi]|uniref:Uncharacterized protein n=1 Tax=Ooceraea biroi TaxID=2015173 RepID=A0A026WR54_OOCBI|nr:hypothetical protein X777_14684 [Ooceraea biroi]
MTAPTVTFILVNIPHFVHGLRARAYRRACCGKRERSRRTE